MARSWAPFGPCFSPVGQRLVAPVEVFVDPAPALLDHHPVAGHQVPAGGAGVAVAVVVEPEQRGAGSVFAQHQLIVFAGLAFGQAGRGLDVEARPGQQVARQDLLRAGSAPSPP